MPYKIISSDKIVGLKENQYFFFFENVQIKI